jgi:hypothetical protein
MLARRFIAARLIKRYLLVQTSKVEKEGLASFTVVKRFAGMLVDTRDNSFCKQLLFTRQNDENFGD